MASASNTVSFQVLNEDGGARRASLVIGEKTVETPTLFLYSKKGNPVNLTPDLLQKLYQGTTERSCVQVGFHELYSDVPTIRAYGKGLHSFVHLSDSVMYVAVRDPHEYVEWPISESAININTKAGRKKVSPAEFMDIQSSLQCDLYECISVDVPYYVTTKKIRKSVEASLAWLDKCLQVQKQQNRKQNMMAVIQGGSDIRQRERCAKEIANKEVAGFVLGSLGLGEDEQQREVLVRTMLKELPATKPRMAPGLGTPLEILHAVSLGVDLFNTDYPNLVTEWGHALVFSLQPPATPASPAAQEDIIKINLRDKQYQLETRAVLEGCRCFTCTHHTRAYIHHLLNVHELLANVLLTIHNCHLYLEFFRTIRQHIASNTFSSFKSLFIQYHYADSNNSNNTQ